MIRRLPTVALLLACLGPARAGAEFRYMLVTDARAGYNTRLFEVAREPGAGQPDDSRILRGVVTELEPGVRLFHHRPRELWTLNAAVVLQYIRLENPSGEDEPNAFAHSERLDASWNYRIDRRSEIGVNANLSHGMENTTTAGQLDRNGSWQGGLQFTDPSRYLSSSLTLGYSNALAGQWTVSPRAVGTWYSIYDETRLPGALPQPQTFGLDVGVPVAYALERHSFTVTPYTMLSQELRVTPEDYRARIPSPLGTYVVGGGAEWRWTMTELWELRAAGGVALQLLDQFRLEGDAFVVDDATTFSPTADVGVRYRRGQTFAVTAGGSFGYENRADFAASTNVRTATANSAGHWILGDWALDWGAGFTWLETRQRLLVSEDDRDLEESKVVQAEASVAYRVFPGVSVHLGYDLDVVVDPPPIVRADFTTTPPTTTTVEVRNIYRHVVTLGMSLAYPPPPPQDVRMNRRESDYQPLFTSEE